jgi:hypothetical protein
VASATTGPSWTGRLGLCRLYGATLVVAKLDRLTRNVAFIAKLMESGVDFVAVDFPQANRLTVRSFAYWSSPPSRGHPTQALINLTAPSSSLLR